MRHIRQDRRLLRRRRGSRLLALHPRELHNHWRRRQPAPCDQRAVRGREDVLRVVRGQGQDQGQGVWLRDGYACHDEGWRSWRHRYLRRRDGHVRWRLWRTCAIPRRGARVSAVQLLVDGRHACHRLRDCPGEVHRGAADECHDRARRPDDRGRRRPLHGQDEHLLLSLPGRHEHREGHDQAVVRE